ncbi:MAG: hypothetical protein WKG01_35435 [Kofleriaceae bacterium]
MTDRLPLGALHVSPICLGAVDDPDTVLAAYDRGVNFFFVSADLHWPRYQPLRLGLERLFVERPGARDRIVVAGVSYIVQREFCSVAFQELVDAVRGLDRLDVLVAGGAYGSDEPRFTRYATLRDDCHTGARAIGASFHDRGAALRCIADASFDLAFVRYNARHSGANRDLFPHIDPDTHVRLYGFKSTAGATTGERCRALGLGDDFWIPRITDYYRFALVHPAVDGVLCAPRTPLELAGLADALAEGPLDPDEVEHLLLLAQLDAGVAELGAAA